MAASFTGLSVGRTMRFALTRLHRGFETIDSRLQNTKQCKTQNTQGPTYNIPTHFKHQHAKIPNAKHPHFHFISRSFVICNLILRFYSTIGSINMQLSCLLSRCSALIDLLQNFYRLGVCQGDITRPHIMVFADYPLGGLHPCSDFFAQIAIRPTIIIDRFMEGLDECPHLSGQMIMSSYEFNLKSQAI